MSALKTLLVHLDASPTGLARLTLAHQWATQHDSLVSVLYATTPADLLYPLGFGTGYEAAALLDDLEATRRNHAKGLFDSAVASGMTRLQWSELGRQESLSAFVEQAFYADLVVLGQREPESVSSQGVPADFVEWVVMDSGKPTLVLPYIGVDAQPARKVLVAWKPSRESARAVAAALPLLQAAAQVDVVWWHEPGRSADDASVALLAYLQRHGISAIAHACGEASAEMGDLLLSRCSDLASDLLVMGCYGHTRAREWVLGGVTRTLLRSMTLPVLMVH